MTITGFQSALLPYDRRMTFAGDQKLLDDVAGRRQSVHHHLVGASPTNHGRALASHSDDTHSRSSPSIIEEEKENALMKKKSAPNMKALVKPPVYTELPAYIPSKVSLLQHFKKSIDEFGDVDDAINSSGI